MKTIGIHLKFHNPELGLTVHVIAEAEVTEQQDISIKHILNYVPAGTVTTQAVITDEEQEEERRWVILPVGQ
jgi:hypothetical protein